jgi:type II secretory pathway pseudopilin PulG
MKRSLVVLALVGGCHKDRAPSQAAIPSPGAPASTAEQDALWAKAPEGAIGGIVASGRAMTMGEHAWHDLHAFMKTFPEFAPAEQEMTAHLAKVGLASDFTLADVGLAPDKGFALFVLGDASDVVGLLPVVDRDKFLAKVKGTKGDDFDHIDDSSCKPVDGGFYACARDPSSLGKLGKGNLRGKLDAAKARGDIEGVMTGPVAVAAVAQLDRGAVVVRGVVDGLPSVVTSKLGKPAKPRVDLDHSSGFAVLNIESMLENVPPLPIVEGVTAADLAHAVNGPLTVSVGVGDLVVDARVPLRDTEAAQKVIEHCADLPPLAAIGAKIEGGACHVPVPQYNMALDVWVDGHELRLGTKGRSPSSAVAPATAIGAELAKGEWQVALWGHGTLLGPNQLFSPALAGAMPAEAAMAIRAIAMLNEVGIGVTLEGGAARFVFVGRSAWSNPDDVVAKLTAVAPEDVLGGKGGDRGRAIADSAPKSPFAADYQAGAGGLMIPTAVIGIVAAVAIPAYLQYMKKSKETEASLQLNKIGKSLKRYYGENGKFPIGDAKTLPDFPTCCGLSGTGAGVDGRCPNDPASWSKDKIWSAIEFGIDEPTTYRYTYHSDGKTFTATAIGDTDCDGEFAKYELTGSAPGGVPELTLATPPHGVY